MIKNLASRKLNHQGNGKKESTEKETKNVLQRGTTRWG